MTRASLAIVTSRAGGLAELGKSLGVLLGWLLACVDAHAVDPRADARGELVDQLGGLLLTDPRVGVKRTAVAPPRRG